MDICTYVISEDSLEYIVEAYSDLYEIITVRVTRDPELCLRSAGADRVARDAGRYNLPSGFFAFNISGGTFSVQKILNDADDMIRRIGGVVCKEK